MPTQVTARQEMPDSMYTSDEFKKFLSGHNLKLIYANTITDGRFVVKIERATVTDNNDLGTVGLSVWGTGLTPQEAINDYIRMIDTKTLVIDGKRIAVPSLNPFALDGPKKTKSAAYIIPIVGSSVLLLFRKKWIDEGTPVIFPGGGVEEGDTALECALKEFKQETGVDADSGRVKYLMTETTQWTGRITFFTCQFESIFFPYSEKEHDKFFGHVWLDLDAPISWITGLLMPGARMAIATLLRQKHSDSKK